MIRQKHQSEQHDIHGIDTDHFPCDFEDVLWSIAGMSTTTWPVFFANVHQTPSPFLLPSCLAKAPQVFERFYRGLQILVHAEIRDRAKTLHTISILPVKKRGEHRHIERQKGLKFAISQPLFDNGKPRATSLHHDEENPV
tara:strand:- start:557 stop:976 length:420 start_codon:yes stop_codon:yes gene_type:complete